VRVPVSATWAGTSSRPSHPPLPPAGACPSVQRGWQPPPATHFPVERGSVCATWTDPSSRILPRDVSMSACATWAGTSSRLSLPSTSSHSLTYLEEDSSVVGIDSPRALRSATCATPCVPHPARPSRLAACVSPGASRPASRLTPSVIFIPATLSPIPPPPRLPYIIPKNRATSCKQ
jgi:hypothetical protein